MKSVLAAAFLSFVTTASALELTSTLDYSNLYGPTDAGVYDVKLELNLKNKILGDAHQSLVKSPKDDEVEMNPRVCQTTLVVDAGTAILTLTDLKTREVLKLTEPVQFRTAHTSETAQCIELSELLEATNNNYTMRIEFKSGLDLNYKAPRGYQVIRTWLSAMPFGYTVKVVGEFQHDLFVFRGLENQLKSQVKTGPGSGLSYNVVASDGTTVLSLGSGSVPLK